MPLEKRFTEIVAFGERLARARNNLKLSQETLAEIVGTTARSISRWEHNQATPQPYYLERICKALQISPETFNDVNEAKQQNPIFSESIPFWHVPYMRNPYFTGRDALLGQLHARLLTEYKIALSYILSGLGGIGKTQTALEYAYRFRNDYQAVLWVGAETYETLMADYLALAWLFRLPEKDSTNHSLITTAVKRWFQSHTSWLLIFDNVEDLDLLHKMLPDTHQGHILVTTRSQVVGVLGSHIILQRMEPAEGSLMLLRRAKLLDTATPLENASDSLRAQAEILVELLDGLPLALDQAAAYIEETACSLPDYLKQYTTHQKELLDHRGMLSNYHPASIASTLSLAFQQVEQTSPVAADLLRVCAFLHAEMIPEEFFTKAGEALGPFLQRLVTDQFLLDGAIRELRRFSLIHREQETKTLRIHRLLQAVIQDEMDEEECRMWMERIIRGMLQIFPTYENSLYDGHEVLSRYQKHLPHALLCFTYMEAHHIASGEAGELSYRIAAYLVHVWGDTARSKPLLLRAMLLAEKNFGREHIKVARYLYGLAFYYTNAGHYIQAEECFRQSLAVYEKLNGPDHPEIAQTLWSMAGLFCHMGKYSQAVSLARRALKICEQAFGPHHYKIAMPLNALGWSYTQLGEFAQAEALLFRAKNIYKQTLGGEHSLNVSYLNNLASLYSTQGYYEKAVKFYKKALQICEQQLRPENLVIAILLDKLGNVYFSQKKYKLAKRIFQRSAMTFEKSSEARSFFAAYPHLDLGELYYVQGWSNLAKHSLQQAFIILEVSSQVDQVDHLEITRCLLLAGDRLTACCELMGAQIYYQRAMAIGMCKLGSDHPLTRCCSSNLEKLAFLARLEEGK